MTTNLPTRRNWLFWARLAWLALALISFGAYLWLIPYRIEQAEVSGWSEWSETDRLNALAELGVSADALSMTERGINLMVPLLYLGLAGILFWKRSDEPAVLLWASAFLLFFAPYATLGEMYPAWKPVGDLTNSLGSTILFVALYTFPDGRFRPRWTLWAVLLIAAIQIWRLFEPELYGKYVPIFMIGFYISIPLAQVYRYFRLSNASQRQQIKWVVFGLAICAVPLAIFLLILASTPTLMQPTASGMAAFLMGNLLWTAFMFILPLSVFIAILRSQLWDIDLIIRKTLVYGALTLVLALVFFGGVALLQQVFGRISGTENSPFAIVLSTLAIAALFSPLRRRVQDFIDRRFYRQKYNAEKALAEFAQVARSETNIEQLSTELLAVAQETLQPESASLWLAADKERIRQA